MHSNSHGGSIEELNRKIVGRNVGRNGSATETSYQQYSCLDSAINSMVREWAPECLIPLWLHRSAACSHAADSQLHRHGQGE